MKDEFYIGWEDRAPAGQRRLQRTLAFGLPLLAVVAGLALAASQQLIGTAFFEWGQIQAFTGVLQLQPYPHLVLPAPTGPAPGGAASPRARAQAAPLVAPFKFGLNPEPICSLEGQLVQLRATRVHRDDQLLLEVEPGSVSAAATSTASAGTVAHTNTVSFGRQVFRGEIVDSKCWLGVMNPGALTPHRACAIRCLSGGIPPILLVRRPDAPPLHLLLADADGRPINDRILDFVAEPVTVEGELIQQGPLLVLRANPSTIRR